MPEGFRLSQMLRPVGQMLEPLNLESFVLRIDNEKVSVQAQKRVERQTLPPPEMSLRVVWQALRHKKPASQEEPKPNSGVVELSYTREDIERIDSEGKSKRKDTGGRPDAHALSQILRSVGAYIDQKQGKLLSVTKDGQELRIEYESLSKQPVTESFTVSSLYDFWIKMYLRRRERS
jgi:hypothetical protein